MLSRDQLKVHAAFLMFFIHQQVKDLSTEEEKKKKIEEVVDGLNSMFIFGILNLQVYQDLEKSKRTTIPKLYKELSLFLHPDKLKEDIQYLGTPIFRKIESHKDMSVDALKI